MNVAYLLRLLLTAVAVVFAIVVHESAHALAAYLLGDRTARSRGRMSLNPLRHVDPFGTVLLPLLLILAGGPVFAFAKPVPVYLGNLKHPKRDEVLVSLAGPASNILLACLAALVLRALSADAGALAAMTGASGALIGLADFLLTSMAVNLSLAFFNLIPLPPLDGSSVLVPFLKGRALEGYYRLQRYAMPILLVALYLLPQVGIDIVGAYFGVTMYPAYAALASFALGLV